MGLLSSLWEKRKPKILAVDDDPMVRDLVKDLLTAQGYDVHTAEDGLQGLARFKQERFDLLILDCRMPRMDGTDLLAAIRATPEGKKQAVIMLSSEKMMGTVVRAFELGIIEWIPKPFAAKDLLAKVVAHLNAIKR